VRGTYWSYRLNAAFSLFLLRPSDFYIFRGGNYKIEKIVLDSCAKKFASAQKSLRFLQAKILGFFYASLQRRQEAVRIIYPLRPSDFLHPL
jgi:hypothetical protein